MSRWRSLVELRRAGEADRAVVGRGGGKRCAIGVDWLGGTKDGADHPGLPGACGMRLGQWLQYVGEQKQCADEGEQPTVAPER